MLLSINKQVKAVIEKHNSDFKIWNYLADKADLMLTSVPEKRADDFHLSEVDKSKIVRFVKARDILAPLILHKIMTDYGAYFYLKQGGHTWYLLFKNRDLIIEQLNDLKLSLDILDI